MRHLRFLGLALGAIMVILIGAHLGKGGGSAAAALLPAALGAVVLFAASVQPAYSLERRRLVAACWIVAAAAAVVSLLVVLSFQLTQLSRFMIVVVLIEGAGAVYALRRRRFYRPKFYNHYLQD